MKIFILHPYKELGNWNMRLKKQIEMMREKHEIQVLKMRIGLIKGLDPNSINKILCQIKTFNPDLLYVSGFLLERITRVAGVPYVYDFGSFVSRNILIQQTGKNIKEFLGLPNRELISLVEKTSGGDCYRKEKAILEGASSIISWDSDEIELARRLFGEDVYKKIKPISMMFSELPKPIPFKEKKGGIIAIAPKWGDRDKNLGLLERVEKECDIDKIGHGTNLKFLRHEELMERLNNSKVLFCPYKAGGCGVVSEGLRLGCNVVVIDYYPFKVYVNHELITTERGAVETLRHALKTYYPSYKMPSQKEQMDKILKVCEEAVNK